MRVLKLGGSVVTVKEEPMTPHTENIRRLAGEIASASPRGLVVVHGGGSFGHPLAKRHAISEGYSSPEQVPGFSRTHQAMVALNRIMVDTLLDASVPAVSVSPSSFIVTDGGRIGEVDFGTVQRFMESEMVPVLHGDAVLDRVKGFTILSGDQLAVRLALDLGADQLIFGADVDGVYTADPKLDPQARLIERLSLSELDEMVEIGDALATDVTGGMLGKIREAASAVDAGIEVSIVNASEPGRVLKALRGENVTGTLLTR